MIYLALLGIICLLAIALIIAWFRLVVQHYRVKDARKLAGDDVTPYAKAIRLREMFEERMNIKIAPNRPAVSFTFKRFDHNDPLFRLYRIYNPVNDKSYGELDMDFHNWPLCVIVYNGQCFRYNQYEQLFEAVHANLKQQLKAELAQEESQVDLIEGATEIFVMEETNKNALKAIA